ARIWGLNAPQPYAEPLVHDAKVNCVRFSRDGLRLLTSTASGIIRMWDVETGQPLADPVPSPTSLRSIAWSEDEQWIVTSEGLKFQTFSISGGVPEWLADIAELIAGVR